MKVAVLVPRETYQSKADDTRSLFLSKLPGTLEDAAIDFTLFPISGDENSSSSSIPTDTLHDLYTFFSKAEGFDLIHNLVGLSPLYLNPRPAAPILTTLLTPPDDKMKAFVQSSPPLVYFCAVGSVEGLSGANYLGKVEVPEMAKQIPDLYDKIHALTRREDHRPWGYYVVLADEADHKVKRIVVWPEKRLSLQRHRRRSEHWHVVQGKAVVTLDDRQIPLEAGESVDIPKGAAHRIQNPDTREELVFIEIQRGDYFGEDDIERLEDDYGRV